VRLSSIISLSAGSALIGGSFSVWTTPNNLGKYLLPIGIIIILIGTVIEVGLAGNIKQYISWRKDYKIALMEQNRIKFQLEERIKLQIADRATGELIIQLIETESDEFVHTLYDYIANTLVLFTRSDKTTAGQLLSNLGRFFSNCPITERVKIIRTVKENGYGESSYMILSSLMTDFYHDFANKTGNLDSLLIMRSSDIDAISKLVDDHHDIPRNRELINLIIKARESILARQALSKIN